ncbi:NADP-dependent oxidoreductase [Mesobacterium sp. TK19101]|uniref:NADP-dependent oxidoreductase n=1 Tax=Mesobacterium hydrothermale TaxID=3111907 RepID=A0ABU6HK50_9RHOB|nr:NADP-dependent oxidoreductase [Mesobacterium sp. TK19101]MEC3861530.1 NADP-dependent oxidoreductase [Mesobacterium sp. TK19101]
MKNRMTRIALARRPQGAPVAEDFAFDHMDLPDPAPGEVLVEVSHLSLDPYMRGRMNDVKSYAPSVGIGETMTGEGVGRVVATNDPRFSVGDLVVGVTGWATHACLSGSALRKLDDSLPPSTALGVLGMPGFTAWASLNAYGRPKAGQTLVVAAATGPVGSMVGQLAKAAGMRTVAIAGGAEKCRIATETFGFDAAIDHRAFDTASALHTAIAEAAPDGIDIYFENVAGMVLEAVIPLLNTFARIPVIGTIAWYNELEDSADRLPMLWRSVLVKRLSINGFIVYDHWDKFDTFLAEVGPKVAAGEIAYLEDVVQGIDKMPAAFAALLEGGNTGKLVVEL